MGKYGKIRFYLVMALVALWVAPVFAQQPDPYKQLQELSQQYPALQYGQPSHQAESDWISQRFEGAAQRGNAALVGGEAAVAEVELLFQNANKAREEVIRLKDELEKQTQTGATADSVWYVRYTLENPWPTVLLLLALIAALITAWRTQKRVSLLAVSAVCAVAMVALPIAAFTVETVAERITAKGSDEQSQATTTAAYVESIRQAQAKALEADRHAALALRGRWQYGRMTSPSVAFMPGHATLSLADAPAIRLEQVTPNLVEPGNLPADSAGMEWMLFYAGMGTADDLRPIGDTLRSRAKNKQKSVVLMAFACSKRWLDAVRYGADAVIFLEPNADTATTLGQAALKFTESPLTIPRFYMKRADLTTALGEDWRAHLSAEGIAVNLAQPEPGRWVSNPLVIDWLFIPGTAEEGSPESQQLIHFQTYRDTASVVPALSPSVHTLGNVLLMMRMLDRFEQPDGRSLRPVLLSVVDQHANAMQGEQEFAYFAFADPIVLGKEMEWLEERLAHERFALRTYDQPLSSELLERLRTEQATVAGSKVSSKASILDRLTELRNLARELRVDSAGESELKDIQAANQRLVRLMMLFNEIGQKVHYNELDDREREWLATVFKQVADRARVNVEQMEGSMNDLLGNLAIRRKLRWLVDQGQPDPDTTGADYDELFALQYRPLPAAAVFCLDLGFDTDRIGFFHVDHLTEPSFGQGTLYADVKGRTDRLALTAASFASTYANRTGQPNPYIDTLWSNNPPWTQHLAGKVALGSSVMVPHCVTALTLTSVQDQRAYAFTPWDMPERVEPERFNRLIRFAEGYLLGLIAMENFGDSIASQGTPTPGAATVSALMQERFMTTVPRKPAPGALIVSAAAAGTPGYFPEDHCMFSQVRPHLVLQADARGAATIRGNWHNGQALQAFVYDADFRNVSAADDLGMGERQFVAAVSIPANEFFSGEVRVALSRFEKVDLVGLTSPLTMSPLAGLRILDAMEDSVPRHWSVIGVGVVTETAATGKPPFARDGTASVFVEPGDRFKLRLGDTIALNISQEDESPNLKGKGFPSNQGLIRDLADVSFRDMQILTRSRLDLLNSKGVSEKMAREFDQLADDIVKKNEDRKWPAVELDRISQTDQARGLEFRAYVRAKGIINDLTTAVVVFMALIIPFCFFVMKLVTPHTDIGRQLLLFAIIFALMVAVLYFVHPAFSLSETPIVVVLAFIILGLAAFVAMILIGRFNASMTQMVEQVLQSESAEASQGRLAEAAFLVGVNNMKRRRIRTTLTTATIILVTFTMLSVISVGQEVDPAMVRQNGEAAYNGFVFRRPGNGAIHQLQMDALRRRYGRGAVTVARVWGQRNDAVGAYLGFDISRAEPPAEVQPGTILLPDDRQKGITANVLLGLDVAEDGFVRRLPLTGNWFSSNDASEIVLSAKAASVLGVNVASFQPCELVLLGMKLKLVGLLDDEKIKEFKDLADIPLLPLQSKMSADSARIATEASQEEASGTAALESSAAETDQRPVDPVYVAFMPINLVQSLGMASYRTLSVKFVPDDKIDAPPAQRAWDEANRMIRFQHQRLLVGLTNEVKRDERSDSKLRPGQYALLSSTSTQVGGVLKAAIPIILAATIILNTMLSSVLERKREVAIYNAIGLNPGHVIVFFLAESLVFGIVGAVSGYLIGQVLSIIITYFHFVDLNLNYSSLSVILVIVLTIATVLLSTVYPALMAARAAVPSGQRRWSLPRPTGDQIHVNFPFSYDARRVLGVCAYLNEFMEQNSEASTGKFLARRNAIGLVPTHAEGTGTSSSHASRDHAFAMVFDIAPAPFDLGVNQKMEIYACYDPRVRAHMLSVYLTRESGERSNWVTINQPFLESLRKRLLAWRSQSAEIQSAYYEKGEQLFADAPLLPTVRS